MTRLLLTAGSIETIALPGDRATYYRLKADAFEDHLEQKLRSLVTFGDLAQRGLDLLEGSPPEKTERLRKIVSMYSFLEVELTSIIRHWRENTDD